LEKVEQLQAVSYQSKSDGRHEIGVIAEDVDRVLPEVVSRDPETNQIQGVDYARLAALLIEAVKSQQAEIQPLKAQQVQLQAVLGDHSRIDRGSEAGLAQLTIGLRSTPLLRSRLPNRTKATTPPEPYSVSAPDNGTAIPESG